jgi:general secretion pathway protein K
MTARLRRPGAERGAALLVAMVAIAVITALAVDLAYESRVSLRIAANARDDLRASYRARSGIALSRLVLSFQQTVDELPANAVPGMAVPRVQLWRLIPVGSELAASLFPGAGAPPQLAAEGEPPEGGFEAQIDDEGRKVNADLEAAGGEGGGAATTAAARVQAMYQLICAPEWDALFDREDAHGIRTSREELLVRLRDWVDPGDQDSGLRAASSPTHCATVVAEPPWEKAYGDENQPYDRGEDRYRTKNARMDSLDELFMVAGIGDAFMAAFGDALTVYLPRDGPGAKRNVNELDRARLVENAALVASPKLQARLFDPEFGEVLQTLMLQQTVNGYLSITPTAFGQLVQAAGVQVNQALLSEQNVNSPFTDRSITFRIRSSGKAGDVTSAIDAVVRLEKAQPGVPEAAPGRLVRWKEE